jgi:hypothetical protein
MWYIARLTGMAQTYPEDITVPEPQVVSEVYSNTLFSPTEGNRAAAAGTRLSQPALEEASST